MLREQYWKVRASLSRPWATPTCPRRNADLGGHKQASAFVSRALKSAKETSSRVPLRMPARQLVEISQTPKYSKRVREHPEGLHEGLQHHLAHGLQLRLRRSTSTSRDCAHTQCPGLRRPQPLQPGTMGPTGQRGRANAAAERRHFAGLSGMHLYAQSILT